MLHYFLMIFLLIVLILLFSLCVYVGRKLGIKHLLNATHPKTEIVGVAESAVFGLLALLIAFTFSGAYERFESRKMHLVEEADMFDKAYNYIDIIPQKYQTELRDDMRAYFDAYIAAFNDIPDMEKVEKDLAKALIYEDKIWNASVAAGETLNNVAYAQIYMPAFNDMFEAAHKGYYLTQIHPPRIIFVLLIGLAALGAFLVGYNSAENKQKYPLHSMSYIILTAFTIYLIINIEYPRVGFITMPGFEKILSEVRQNMR